MKCKILVLAFIEGVMLINKKTVLYRFKKLGGDRFGDILKIFNSVEIF